MTEHDGSPPVESMPLWFGPEDRSLFGWLHLPGDRTVHGGVVLCPPLGIEAICTYYTYRLLAEALAARGLAVLRFDYDGTGDSCGQESDPDRVDAWLSSLATATDTLLETGAPRLGLVGLRMGGLFAGHEAARRRGVDALVLWDACLSGKAFLREQRFLRVLSGTGDDPGDEAVEAPGLRFEPSTATALADLDLTRTEGPLAARTLVLTPPNVSRPRRLERRLTGHPVEWQEATGQDLLLDSHLQTPPTATIARTADWLSTALDGRAVTATVPTSPTSAVVARTSTGQAVEERTVTFGPPGLFGIVTEPAGGTDGPTVVLVDEGNTPHIGQARIWVDLARRLAPSGLRVLRFDLSGNGDSGVRPGQATHVARAPEAFHDVSLAVREVSPTDPTDVVLVGFCSGAYQVIEQALAQPPRGICVINPAVSFVPPEPAGSVPRPARQASRRWLVRLVGVPLRRLAQKRSPAETDRWTTALEAGSWPVALATRHPGIPSVVWRTVNRLLLERIGISSLERIVDHGVDTLLVCGPDDLLPISLGAERRLRDLQASGRFRLELLDELDHASWVKHQRDRLIEVVNTSLATAYGPDPAGSEPSRGLRVGSSRPG